jgi:hypothetical protein
MAVSRPRRNLPVTGQPPGGLRRERPSTVEHRDASVLLVDPSICSIVFSSCCGVSLRSERSDFSSCCALESSLMCPDRPRVSHVSPSRSRHALEPVAFTPTHSSTIPFYVDGPLFLDHVTRAREVAGEPRSSIVNEDT